MKLKGTFTAPLLAMASILLLVASRILNLSALSYNENISLAVIVIQLMILAVPSIIYAKLRGEKFEKRLRFRAFGIEKLLVTLLAALTLILGDVILKLTLHNFGLMSGEYSVYSYYLANRETNVVYILLTFCAVPAVCEELLFRGVLCAEYEQNGVITAVLTSSALYAMFGLNFSYFPIYFFAGIIFALIMYLTQSVLAAMLCHFIYNVAVYSLGETVWNIIVKPQSMGFLIFVLVGLFLVCLVSLFGECERIYFSYSMANRNSDYAKSCPKFSPKLFAEAILAPPFLIAALVFTAGAIQFMK